MSLNKLLSSQQNLTSLSLSALKLLPPDLAPLCQFLHNSPVQTLDLSHCNIDPYSFTQISQALGKLRNIKRELWGVA